MPEYLPGGDTDVELDTRLSAALSEFFARAEPAIPVDVLEGGLAELQRQFEGETPLLGDLIVEVLDGDRAPEVPLGLLEGGLRLLDAAFAEAASESVGAQVVPLRPRRWSGAVLPAVLAVAAAGSDQSNTVAVDGDADGLRARWERRSDGAVSVMISAVPPAYEALVELDWRLGDSDEVQRLVTPLAGARSGAYVVYDVIGPGDPSRSRSIELGVPVPIAPAEVDVGDVHRAFEGHPQGVVVRAWQEFLATDALPAAVAEVVRPLLAAYAE